MKRDKYYTVATKFVFNGTFTVKAVSRNQAIEKIMRHCDMHVRGKITHDLPEDIAGYSFSETPKKIIKT